MPIRIFTIFAILLAANLSVHADDKLFTKVYGVADLVIPINGNPANQLAKCPSVMHAGAGGEGCKDELAAKLVDLVRLTVEPDSWYAAGAAGGGAGRVEFYPIGHGLVVTQTADVHRQLEAFLASLRSLQDAQITIEVEVVRLPAETLKEICCEEKACAARQIRSKLKEIGTDACDQKAQTFIVLGPEQAEQVAKTALRAERLSCPRITVFNGQRSRINIADDDSIPASASTTCSNTDCVDRSSLPVDIEMLPVLSADRTAVAIETKCLVGRQEFKAAALVPCKGMLVMASQRRRETHNQCPVGVIPHLGKLFRNTTCLRSEEVTLILVKPRVLDVGQALAAVSKNKTSLSRGCAAVFAVTPCSISSPTAAGHSVPPGAATTDKEPKAEMNLADVVALSSSGVSDEIIINQMYTTQTQFKLSTEDILFLKKNKISDRVVLEMQQSRLPPIHSSPYGGLYEVPQSGTNESASMTLPPPWVHNQMPHPLVWAESVHCPVAAPPSPIYVPTGHQYMPMPADTAPKCPGALPAPPIEGPTGRWDFPLPHVAPSGPQGRTDSDRPLAPIDLTNPAARPVSLPEEAVAVNELSPGAETGSGMCLAYSSEPGRVHSGVEIAKAEEASAKASASIIDGSGFRSFLPNFPVPYYKDEDKPKIFGFWLGFFN